MALKSTPRKPGSERKQGHLNLAGEIRKAIVRGVFRGGQPLRQDVLAATYGTSAIPVREALRQLEGEGLVTFLPNRGVVVTELSAAEVRELCEIRILNETEILRLAIPHLDAFTLAKASQILDAVDNDEQFLDTWCDSNWAFHATLYRAANRPQLLALIERLHVKIERYLYAHVALVHYEEQGAKEHRALLRACKRKDVKRAVTALTAHIANVATLLEPYLEQQARFGCG